jgi:predicted Zn finger-like uncharacterized protein
MDVTCERCNTEYEFDDALVSERGTTVKCTNCGFQFKVRRTDGVAAPERWLVRTVDGRELEFTALRDLQAAIHTAKVTRDDVLSRGSSRPRRLGSIAELEPFFTTVLPSTAPGIGSSARMGIAVPGRTEGSVAIPLPTGPGRSADDESRAAAGAGISDAPPRRRERVATLPGVIVAPDNAPPVPRAASEPGVNPMGRTAAMPPAPPPLAGSHGLAGLKHTVPIMNGPRAVEPDGFGPNKTSPMGSVGNSGSSSEPPTVPRMSTPSEPPMATGRRPPPDALTPTPSDVRASYAHEDSFAEPRFSSVRGSRRMGTARWMVGFVVLGVAVFVGVTVVRKYSSSGAATPAAAASDQRIQAFLSGSEKSLVEGDIETTKEQLAKASALSEKDPRVLSALARVAVVEADGLWLHVRLLSDDDPDLPLAKKRLEPATTRASSAVKAAAAASPGDAAVMRYRIDVLRMTDDRAGARALVENIKSTSSQPETQLVLATLELAEEKPDWATTIDRLRAASAGEQELGRGRALLIYALAKSGNVAGARAEHERLAEFKRPHPLVAALRAFIGRLEKGDGGIDVAKLPDNKPDRGDSKPERKREAPPAAPAAPAAPRPKSEPRATASPTARPADGRVPDDYVAPGAGHVDTSDLPGEPKGAPPAGGATPDPAGTKK